MAIPDDETYAKLRDAWRRAKEKHACDLCGQVHQYHHPTCFGENLCHDCYLKHKPCTQIYPGDLGYPPFFHKGRIENG